MKLVLRLVSALVVVGLGLFVWRVACAPRSAGASPRPVREETRSAEAVAPAALVGPESLAAVASAARAEVPAPTSAVVAPSATQATTIRLRVRSKERGEALPGERVFVHEASNAEWSATHVDGSHGGVGEAPLTDAQGWADFGVDPGIDYRVGLIERSSQELTVPALVPLEVREVELVVATDFDRTVFGRLLDAEGGQPPSDGVVRFDAERSRDEKTEPDVPVAADGSFELHVRSWEQRFASASAEGYARSVFALESGHETPEHALDVRLALAATLEVVVLQQGRAVPNAVVELSTDSYQLQQGSHGLSFYFAEDPSWTGTSDALGSATLDALPPRVPLRLSVDVEGLAPHSEAEPLTLEPGEHRRVDVTLGAGATIVGRVEDGAGVAVAGCQVVFSPADVDIPKRIQSFEDVAASSSTDEHGRFHFDDVPRGDWFVGPRPAGNQEKEFVGLAQVVHVEPNAAQIEVILRVDRGLYLRGMVYGPDGEALARCYVSASLEQAWAFEGGQTDADGRFAIGPLVAGTYSLQAGGMGSPYAQCEPVTAEAGRDDLVLRLPLGGTLRCRIVDTSGQLVACEYLIARKEDEERGMMSSTQDGTLEIQGQLPGTYTINARTPAGLCGRVSGIALRAGETTEEFELVVRPGARLKLRYDGEQPAANETIYLDGELFLWCGGQERGTQELVLVPAGAIEVHWMAGEIEATQRISLAPDDERELVWDGKPQPH